MNEISLGIAKSELDAALGYSWAVAKIGSADALKRGDIKMILQLALKKHSDLPNVPLMIDLVRSPANRQVLSLIFSRQAMGRPVVAPHGLAKQVTAALRKGFAETMTDSDFIAECNKLHLETSFVSKKEVAKLVSSAYRVPQSVISHAQAIALH